MPSIEDFEAWRGRDVLDREGLKIGSLEEVYVDEETGRAEFACVKTGLLGRRLTFVPLGEAGPDEAGIRLPFAKDQVRDAPSIEPDGHLSPDEEQQLYRHYGLDRTGTRDARGGPDAEAAGGDGPTDDAERPVGSESRTDAERRPVRAEGRADAESPRSAGSARESERPMQAEHDRPGARSRDDPATAAGDGVEGRPRLRRSTGGLAEGIDERIRAHTQSMGREQAARLDELERRVAALEREIGAASSPA